MLPPPIFTHAEIINNTQLVIYSLPTNPNSSPPIKSINLQGIKSASQIAISPNGKYLAIETRSSLKRQQTFVLRLFDVNVLLEEMPKYVVSRRSSQQSLTRSYRTRDLPSEVPEQYGMDGLKAQHFDLLQDQDRGNVERPQGVDKIVLRFAGDNRHLYYAFYHCTEGRKQLKIMIWDVEMRQCMERYITQHVWSVPRNFAHAIAHFDLESGLRSPVCDMPHTLQSTMRIHRHNVRQCDRPSSNQQ
jgi:hypothetical protein